MASCQKGGQDISLGGLFANSVYELLRDPGPEKCIRFPLTKALLKEWVQRDQNEEGWVQIEAREVFASKEDGSRRDRRSDQCMWQVGDGRERESEILLPETFGTREACAFAVRTQHPGANGATWEVGGRGRCWAENSVYSTLRNSKAYVTCRFDASAIATMTCDK